MSESRVPSNSRETIKDFLTFLAIAKQNPETDSQLWNNLADLEQKIADTEDKPAKLALQIKQWCKQWGISLNSEELQRTRANLIQQGKKIPKPLEGEKPQSVGNKTLIVDSIKTARREHQNE